MHTSPGASPPPPPRPGRHSLLLLMTTDMAVQDRQRRGIPGIHMRSLNQHLDQQELQKLLGEVIHHTRASTDHPAPDHQLLAKVAISRQVLMSLTQVSKHCRRALHAEGVRALKLPVCVLHAEQMLGVRSRNANKLWAKHHATTLTCDCLLSLENNMSFDHL